MPKAVSTKKVKESHTVSDKGTSTKMLPTWELAIADAEEQIAQLRRSIELFKYNQKIGILFPASATRD